ncbi:MAG: hypothetical protein ABEJ99_00835 [Candidatus Nanohaloarchaea archaeon]
MIDYDEERGTLVGSTDDAYHGRVETGGVEDLQAPLHEAGSVSGLLNR